MVYTKAQARVQVETLVANFRANEPSLADVPEAQIEDNYIPELFHCLNMRHVAQRCPCYKNTQHANRNVRRAPAQIFCALSGAKGLSHCIGTVTSEKSACSIAEFCRDLLNIRLVS